MRNQDPKHEPCVGVAMGPSVCPAWGQLLSQRWGSTCARGREPGQLTR